MDQYSLADSLNVVAAALLGFEAVLITLIRGQLDEGCRTASIVLLTISMLFLFACLLDRTTVATWPPWRGPFKARQPQRLDIQRLEALYAGQPVEQTAKVLLDSESDLYRRNDQEVQRPKRRSIDIAVYFLAAALLAYGLGALIGSGSDHVVQPASGQSSSGPTCPSHGSGCCPSEAPNSPPTAREPRPEESAQGTRKEAEGAAGTQATGSGYGK
ncbi:hypothetical protein [Kitasatospora sp. Root107]|uniref:hypothetical protein n=1 Tax=Kitasatospora sp. Root107 TaxID=1736424 RepID=UPI000A6ACE0D|nr:hypothetical protein [Kitasatospora sp. Root107]